MHLSNNPNCPPPNETTRTSCLMNSKANLINDRETTRTRCLMNSKANNQSKYNKMLMYTGVVFVFLYLIYLCYKNSTPKWKRNWPVNWPVFGMLPRLLLNIGRIHEYATEILEQNGGTIMLKGPLFTSMKMMITSDPVNVHYILSKNFKNFQKGPDFKKLFDFLGDGIFTAESESWLSQRKTLMSLIKDASFHKFVATSCWNKLEIGLIPILDHVSDMGTKVDLQELFQRFAFDCSCIQVLGHDPVSLCKELPYLPYEKAFVDAEEAIWQRHLLPETLWKFQKWLNLGKERKLSKSKEILDHFVSYCISLKSQKFTENDRIVTNGNEDFDLLTSYMKLIAEKGPDAPHDSTEGWRDNMLNLIFAGKDTISASLTWFFWLLATHPEEEIKIRQEIMTNLKVGKDGKWNFSNMDELKKLNYLHAALCETLRLFPPIAIQHKAPLEEDILPTGHRISPNTKTLLLFYSMGRMESIWGKDCLEFKPERWIYAPGHIKIVASSKFTAFNAGPRSCLGKEMSFLQLKIVAAAIISRYRIQVLEGHPIQPSSSVILHMKHGLKIKVSNYV